MLCFLFIKLLFILIKRSFLYLLLVNLFIFLLKVIRVKRIVGNFLNLFFIVIIDSDIY